jgi:hypothetical protein
VPLSLPLCLGDAPITAPGKRETEEEFQDSGERIIGTRTVEVTIPDVDLSELGWSEAILLPHLAFGTPFPIAAEYEPKGDSEEE